MDTWAKVALAITSVISLLILLGAAWALIRGSFNKARVEELRGDNEDLRKRMKDCEDKIAHLEKDKEKLALQNRHQANEIEHLTSMVTQRAEVDAVLAKVTELMEHLDNHHSEAVGHWTIMERLMGKES